MTKNKESRSWSNIGIINYNYVLGINNYNYVLGIDNYNFVLGIRCNHVKGIKEQIHRLYESRFPVKEIVV